MIITPQPAMSVLSAPVSKHPRSPGIHVSSVIRAMAVQNGSLKAEYVNSLDFIEVVDQAEWWDSLSPENHLRMCMGLAWEEWYLPHLGSVVHQPGEMQVDGIYMTHDGESLDMIVRETREEMVLAGHEVKVTYKSTNTVKDLATQFMWLAQMKAYAKGLKTRDFYMHTLFPCGDYSYPIRPVLKVWHILFTQAEIDDNWDAILEQVRAAQ